MKDITCLRCKKAGQYSNECKEKLPKTSGGKNDTFMLINKDDILFSDFQKNAN